MLMFCGHTPAEIDEMPISDVHQFLDALPAVLANSNLLEAP